MLSTPKILAFITICTSCSLSQKNLSDIVIGKNITIESKILKQKRTIQVYLPESYNESDKKYPVLYLLDGQIYFTNAVALQRQKLTYDLLPEMIIIGIIPYNKYTRIDLNWDTRDNYVSFLSDELLPFVQNNFRTNGDRILFGWENGAVFSSYLAFKTDLFNGLICTNGAYADETLINEYNKRAQSSTRYLYLANSLRDITTIEGTKDLKKLLEKNSAKNLNWKYDEFNNETHASVSYLALYHGLRYYYHNFKPPY